LRDIISSYKGHTLFALILGILFFNNPLTIALTIIGANFPDLDHKIKKDTVYKIIIFGLLIFIILYIFKLPFYLGIIITLIGIIFFFSSHRGFSHSILGLFMLSILISGILFFSLNIIQNFSPLTNSLLNIVILISLLALSLNKNLYLIFFPLFFISLLLFNLVNITTLEIFISIFLGYLSHLILDSFSPSGIKPFSPLSNKKVYKKFGFFISLFLLIIGIYNFYLNYLREIIIF